MNYRLVLLLGFFVSNVGTMVAQRVAHTRTEAISVATGNSVIATPGATVTDRLPVRHVALYKNGVGYFQHDGRVRGNQTVTIAFTTAQLNDVLKSLTAIDLNGGRIADVSYNSTAPLDQRLNALQIPIGQKTTTAEFLDALRGARVEIRNAGAVAIGRLLSVETVNSTSSDEDKESSKQITPHTELSVITDSGELRTFRLTPATSIHLLEHDVNQEVGRYLSLIASTRAADVRKMAISAEGSGDRELMVSYISEVPVWKSTYRIVLPGDAKQKPLLQGWAVVDNTVGEDWDNVELALIAGAPQSFIENISQPYYTRRPEIGLPTTALLTPQTHDATLYEQMGLASKADRLTSSNDRLENYAELNRPPAIHGSTQSLAVEATGGPIGTGSGFGGGIFKSDSTMISAMEQQISTAVTQDIGDLFEYRIKQPVTIHKNQSALVPILQARVDAEKVTLWSPGRPRPLRALWLTNSSGLTLDGGTFSIQEAQTFAGEGLMDAIRPNEKRLISYAADPAVQVKPEVKGEGQLTTLVRIHRGVMYQESQERQHHTYTVRNQDSAEREVIIEHPERNGWKLAEGAKPEETSASAYRFRLKVEPEKTSSLEFEEVHSLGTNYLLSNLTPDQITLFAHQGWMNQKLENALRPIMQQKDEIAGYAQQITATQGKINSIFEDQKRLRENLSALKGGTEVRSLAQRYTNELNREEDGLASLRKNLADLQDKHTAANQKLNEMMEQLEMEVKI
ncbi:MAG TPA: DUF4139 domain-containing protein [Terriglobales bacterium]|jgi:hypothetical protein|nr:DUF4139 domain-containing protein [Terriglobales bacterium]